MTTVTSSRSSAQCYRPSGPVFVTAWLSVRLHVDLLRLASAMCRAR
ncbi:MAG: putative leader peptide [Pseudonocardiaceae bacterium]